MKLLTKYAAGATLALIVEVMVGVGAVTSNSLGARSQDSLALLELFRKHPSQIPEHDVGPMLKSAESMLMKLGASGKSAPLADLVAQIRPFIQQMQDSINAAHTAAQQTVTNFTNNLAGCNNAKTTGESEATSLETTKSGHSNDHRSCRTRQKNANDGYTSCQTTLTALQSAKDSSCQLYEDSKKPPGCPSDVAAQSGETWEAYVARAATYFVHERDTFMQKKAVCTNDTEKLDAESLTCVGADGSSGKKKDLEDVIAECNGIQSELDSATCAYVSKVDDTCTSYATCANTLLDAWDAIASGIETMEHQRKVEWNATERLLCLLDVYTSDGGVDATKLQTCQHSVIDTSHLDLVYPTHQRPGNCADLLPHPCQADYVQTEYGNLDAPAGNCTPCSFATNMFMVTDTTEIRLKNQQGNLLDKEWIIKKCFEPNPEQNWGSSNLWTDSTSLPAGSDHVIYTCDVVTLWIVGVSRVQDCAWGGCSQQPYPPPNGNWGSPYKPHKEGQPCGQPIHAGDDIYFERMNSNAFHGADGGYYLQTNGGGNDLHGGTTKTIFNLHVEGQMTTQAPAGPGPALHAGDCTCDFTIDNWVDKVFVDGVDKTGEVNGNLNSWGTKKTIAFACSTATVLGIQGADAETGCNNGGFAAKCTSTDTASPWHNLIADTNWKVFASEYNPRPTITGAPPNWADPSFDDSGWKNAVHGNTNYAQGPAGTPHDICGTDGKAWLFRSPKFNAQAPSAGAFSWTKGGTGQTCTAACSAVGKQCDAAEQSTITTKELVRDAFAQAGYTCMSISDSQHRGYTGSPFSTGRSGDDCYFITPGSTSVCDQNSHGNHAPLCACV